MGSDEEAARREWDREFEAAARRPLRSRFRYAFIRTYKPVLDAAEHPSVTITDDYPACERGHLRCLGCYRRISGQPGGGGSWRRGPSWRAASTFGPFWRDYS